MSIQKISLITLFALLPACQSVLPSSPAVVRAHHATEQVRVQVQVPGRGQFATQVAQPQQVAFVRVSLTRLDGTTVRTTFQDGAELVPVTNLSTVSVTFSKVPREAGAVRLVHLEAFDAEERLLGTYAAGNYYVSAANVAQINLNLTRERSLLRRVLAEFFASAPARIATLDLVALTELLSDTVDYSEQTGVFNRDPSLFDASEIVALIPEAGPLPTVADLRSNALAPRQNVDVQITTPGGQPIGEEVLLVLNDPYAPTRRVPIETSSGTTFQLYGVVAGTWILSAYDSDDNLLVETTVTVSETGATLGVTPLVLTGVQEIGPDA